MHQARYFFFTLFLMMTPMLSAKADCPETASGTHLWLGVDTSIPAKGGLPDLPAGVDELDLLRVQLVWVPYDPEVRYKDQHVIDIDWVQQTHTNVDVWDGELQSVTIRDLHPVLLPVDTNFDTGQIHIETCYIDKVGYTDGGFSAGMLLFAHYGFDGKILETLVSPGPVTNQYLSDVITTSFNRDRGLAARMTEDVEKATGVTPGHYLAESFLLQNLEPLVRSLVQYPTWFFDAENAVVMQSRIYVTGNDSSASVPFSISGVISNGSNVLDGDYRVHNLEQYLGTLQFQARNGDGLPGYNLVFDARPDLQIATTPCVDGYANLTADFVHPSEIAGKIAMWREGDPGWGPFLFPLTKPSLNERVSCDYDYRVEGRRFFEYKQASSGEIKVPVATAK